MEQENSCAFVLEVEIDDEISFKPLKQKRPLQTIDSNTIPLATPEKRKQIQKCQGSASRLSNAPTPSRAEEPMSPRPSQSSIVMYTDQLENAHKPKYSEAELEALKVDWQKETADKITSHISEVREEMKGDMDKLEGENSSLKRDKSILEKNLNELQTAMLDKTVNESNEIHSQLKVLTDQLQEAKSKNDDLIETHEKEMQNLKASNDSKISEMIKSHATSILTMQERVTQDLNSMWQQKVKEEQELVSSLRSQVEKLNADIESLKEEKIQAVKEAKRKMYDKVTQQFEAGNKKYEALKAACRESQEELEKCKAELLELHATCDKEKAAAEESKSTAQQMKNSVLSVQADIVDCIASFRKEPLESVDITTDDVRKCLMGIIKDELSSRSEKTIEMEKTCEELTAESSRLKDAAELSNKNLCKIQSEKDGLLASLEEVRESLQSTRAQLQSSNEEKESQMLVIAGMITEKGNLEKKLDSATQEAQELSHRCEDLRKMNDEVMSMLEKMYAEKAE